MSESDWLARIFAEQNNLSANEFRALLFVIIAESRGSRMTAGALRSQMGLSGAAITYLVERLVESGHLRRETDPGDRRKVILRYADRGVEVARGFFAKITEHNRAALDGISDEDLETTHRTMAALADAMRAYRAELFGAPTSPTSSPQIDLS